MRQDGWFPLAIAAYHGRLRVAEALVAARADPDAKFHVSGGERALT